MMLLSDETTLCDANDNVIGAIFDGQLTENAIAGFDCNDTVVASKIAPRQKHRIVVDALGTLAFGDDTFRHIYFFDIE